MNRSGGANLPATYLASVGFLVLVVGLVYFALLVLAAHFADGEDRAASYYELARYLSGRREWYLDARVYGAVSLLCALSSVLFGVHPLARVTIPVSGVAFFVLQFYDDTIWEVITSWARSGG